MRMEKEKGAFPMDNTMSVSRMKKNITPRLGLSPLTWGLVLVALLSVLRAGAALTIEQFFGGTFEPTPAFLAFFVVSFIIMSGGLIVGGLRWLGGVSWHELGWTREKLVASIGFGLLGAVLLMALNMAGALIMLSMTGANMPANPPAIPSPGHLLMIFLWGFLFASWQEENLFRGYLQPLLIARTGYWPGIVLQAALFSLAHIGYFTTLFPFVLSFIIGLVLGWMRGRDRSLVAPFLAHGLIG